MSPGSRFGGSQEMVDLNDETAAVEVHPILRVEIVNARHQNWGHPEGRHGPMPGRPIASSNQSALYSP